MLKFDGPGFSAELYQTIHPDDYVNGDADIIVRLDDGSAFSGVVCTPSHIAKYMKIDAERGESANGQYYWQYGMIVVRDLNPTTLQACIEDLIKTGLIKMAFVLRE